ncbi:MAG: O-linked GlcNAc transferase, partial [Bauldia sp.]
MGAGASYGLLGALAAFPRRLARREVECQGGVLRRGLTRRTTHAVFGRRLLERLPDEAIAAHFDAAVAAGAVPLSENGFRRALGLLPGAAAGSLSRQALLDQSGLAPRSFDLLALFDAFEHDAEPFSFRDAVLAKSYARLAAAGAGWGAIARSAHRAGKVTSLTALALHAGEDDAIYRRHGEALTEIDGQHLLPLAADDDDADELFEAAEAAEAAGEPARAAALYARYLGREPTDAVAAFKEGTP